MAVELTGTPTHVVDTTHGDGSISLTIPADCDCVLFFNVGAFKTSSLSQIDKLNFDNGASVDFAEIITNESSGDSVYDQSAFYMHNTSGDWPGTGSQTLYFGFSNDSQTEGGTVVAVFLKGVQDPTIGQSPFTITDTETFRGDESTQHTTDSTNLSPIASGGLTIGCYVDREQDMSGANLGSGETELASDYSNDNGAEWFIWYQANNSNIQYTITGTTADTGKHASWIALHIKQAITTTIKESGGDESSVRDFFNNATDGETGSVEGTWSSDDNPSVAGGIFVDDDVRLNYDSDSQHLGKYATSPTPSYHRYHHDSTGHLMQIRSGTDWFELNGGVWILDNSTSSAEACRIETDDFVGIFNNVLVTAEQNVSDQDGWYASHLNSGQDCTWRNCITWSFERAGWNYQNYASQGAPGTRSKWKFINCGSFNNGSSGEVLGGGFVIYGRSSGQQAWDFLLLDCLSGFNTADGTAGDDVRVVDNTGAELVGSSYYNIYCAHTIVEQSASGNNVTEETGWEDSHTFQDTDPGVDGDYVVVVDGTTSGYDNKDWSLQDLGNARNEAQDHGGSAASFTFSDGDSTVLTRPALDIAGVSRPQNTDYDAGAFEVEDTADTFTASMAVTCGGATFDGDATFSAGTKTGTIDATAGAATFSATATHTAPQFSAVLNVSTGGATFDGDATFQAPQYTGAIDATAGAATFAGSATFDSGTFTAAMAATTGGATFAGTATFDSGTFTATMAATTGGATFDGDATFDSGTFTGAIAATVGAATFDGDATFSPPEFTAAMAATTGGATFSGTATFADEVFQASMSVSTGGATFDGDATFDPGSVSGVIDATTGGATFSGTATFVAPIYQGTMSVSAGGATFAGTATFAVATFTGAMAVVVGGATFDADATFAPGTKTATLDATTGGATFDGDATFVAPIYQAAMNVSTGAATFAGAALFYEITIGVLLTGWKAAPRATRWRSGERSQIFAASPRRRVWRA